MAKPCETIKILHDAYPDKGSLELSPICAGMDSSLRVKPEGIQTP